MVLWFEVWNCYFLVRLYLSLPEGFRLLQNYAGQAAVTR